MCVMVTKYALSKQWSSSATTVVEWHTKRFKRNWEADIVARRNNFGERWKNVASR